jgi:hypothetical protein
MVEKFVQLFVGVIDAKLFERIALKVFESENVQNADESCDVFA